MTHIWLNRATLQGMYLQELVKTFLFYRNANRRELSQHRRAFNQSAWREAAQQLGACWESVGDQISQISLNGVRTRVIDYTSEIDNPVTCALLHNKPLVHQLLEQQDLPVPRHACFSLGNIAPAVMFMKSTQHDCVVKPASGGAGRGVTTGIRSARYLARAAATASVYKDDLLIEEQIRGENYRLLYLDGKLIDAFVRRPPSIMADGLSTVAALVRRTNQNRVNGRAALSQVLIPMDLDMRRTLAKQGLTLHSVPGEGRRITLKTVVNDNCAMDNLTATHLLHRSVIEAGQLAVQILRVRLAGVDIITPNPAVPLHEAGGVILEVNGTPGLYYHYHKSDGAFPAAYHVLKRLLVDDVLTRSITHDELQDQFEDVPV